MPTIKGLVREQELERLGLSRTRVRRMARRGELDQVARAVSSSSATPSSDCCTDSASRRTALPQRALTRPTKSKMRECSAPSRVRSLREPLRALDCASALPDVGSYVERGRVWIPGASAGYV